MFSRLFKRTDRGEEFWTWFLENEPRLWAVSGPDDALFGEIGAHLQRVARELVFEIGPIEDGRRDFVVSADGIVERFPDVTALVDKAPALERWRFIRFRQPGKTGLAIEMPTGFRLDPSDLSLSVEQHDGSLGITMFLPGYAEEPEHIRRAYLSAGFLFLDNTVGEYAVATRVGSIAFKPLHEAKGVETIGLHDLPGLLPRVTAQ